MDGLSLISAADSSRYADRVVVSESPDTGSTALITGEWKLIRDTDGQVELYQLSADPDELLNRSESEPEVVRHLVERLDHRLTEQASSGAGV